MFHGLKQPIRCTLPAPVSYMEKMQIQTTVSAMSEDAGYQSSAIAADAGASK